MNDSGDEPIHVVYVAGWGRSGTTIIGNTFNEVGGFFHTGELNRVWEVGVTANRQCGSGVPFRESPVWQAIFETAFGGFRVIEPKQVKTWRKQSPRNADVIRARSFGQRLELNPNYVSVLERLYRAIVEVTDCSHIIDTSKNPSYGYVLSEISALNVDILHVVRDARATAYSWQKDVIREDFYDTPRKMNKVSTFQNAVNWMKNNIAAELVGTSNRCTYQRLMYEDFASRPKASVEEVLRQLHVEPDLSAFLADDEVHLGANHTVWGNPNRAKSGPTRIRMDDTWRTHLNRKARLLTTSLTWPLLLRYGYV